MNNELVDVFKYYDLPFETYFVRGSSHYNQQHDEIELLWLIKGNARVITDEKEYVLCDQTLFMVNVNQLHSVFTSKDAIMIVYRFKKEHLLENNLSFEQYRFESRVYTFQELVIKYKEVPLLIAQLLKLLMSDEDDKILRYKIIGYYNMFVYELYTMLLKERYLDIKKKNYDSYLKRVNIISSYVQNNYMKKICLDDLADRVKLSRYRLSHFVKEYMGISFQEYVNNMRLEKALRDLSLTQLKISEISLKCGFSDVKYLNKAIKSKLGITALKYRKLSTKKQHLINEDSVLNIKEFSKELSKCLENIDRQNKILVMEDEYAKNNISL